MTLQELLAANLAAGKMTVIGCVSNLYVVSKTGTITMCRDCAGPGRDWEYWYEQVSSLPKFRKSRFRGKFPADYAILEEIPQQHQYKFTDTGEYK